MVPDCLGDSLRTAYWNEMISGDSWRRSRRENKELTRLAG